MKPNPKELASFAIFPHHCPEESSNSKTKFAIIVSWYILFSAGRHQGAQHCQHTPGRKQCCCSYKMVLLFLTMAMDDNFLQDKTAAALATACHGLPNGPACLLPAAPPPPPSATAAVLELAVSSSSTTQHSRTKLRKSA